MAKSKVDLPEEDHLTIRAETPQEWIKKAKEYRAWVYCPLRGASFHRRHCEYLQGRVPEKNLEQAPVSFDIVMKAMNICNRCPVVTRKITVDS